MRVFRWAVSVHLTTTQVTGSSPIHFRLDGREAKELMYQKTDNGISIQVSLSGYSFKIADNGDERSSGWLSPEHIFTTPEFQKRYDSVRISLMTHKVALVPEHFFNPVEIRQLLADTVRLSDGDQAEFIRMPQFGAVLLFSNNIGETLSRMISQTVFTTDGYQARILPEMYYMLESMSECNDYNKIIASYADSYLHLAVAQGKSLQIANVFKAPDFTTAEYFIFNTMKKLQLNPEVSTISFRTPLDAEQEMSLYRYFKAVEQL